MKKRNVTALILSVALLMTALVGCGDQETSKDNESSASKSEVSSKTAESSSEDQDREVITIQHVALGMSSWQDAFDTYNKDSTVYKEFVDKTGVQIEEIGLANDQVQVRIAGGDVGDLISVNSYDHIAALVESDLIMPLNDLIEEYAPNIIEDYPELWERAKEIYPNEEGNVYVLPIMAGSPGMGVTNPRYLYTIRWDLYKELGYPEMKTPDDLLKVLTDMVALQPETPEGKKVYGVSFSVTETSFYAMTANFSGTYGFVNLKGDYISRKVLTDELVYEMIEEDSPYWMAVEFYNKANRAGILDPDCFTQQRSDYNAKMDSGEVITTIFYNDVWEKAQRELDPDFDKGYASVPVEGTILTCNDNRTTGWVPAYALAIAKDSEYAERIAQMLSYTYSEEGARMLTSGVEGVHWDWVDGVPSYNEETMELKRRGGEEWLKEGIGGAPMIYFVGMQSGTVLSDGFHVDLKMDDDYRSRSEYSPVLQDYCEYYDISWPNQIFAEMLEEGKVYDLSNLDFRMMLSEIDEDIARIDAACLKIAIEAIPSLVTAETDAEFEAVKEETLKALENAGALEAKEYYTNMWNEQKAKYAD